MNFEQKYRVDQTVNLDELDTIPDFSLSPKKAIRKIDELSRILGNFQEVLNAHSRYSFLICLQGMDTAGKDGLIREVFKSFNAGGVVVRNFKKPTSTELQHDYLWRHYKVLPEKGQFTVFNRSHYENVLISRVHPEVVLNERLPHIISAEDINDKFWMKRYEEIVNFENHVSNNGVIILKFFLHLGKNEQRKRIIRRLEKDKHQWKFTPEDIKERGFWDDYQKYYEEALRRTSTSICPWYVVPADDKVLCRYIVANIMLDVTEKLVDVHYPALPDEIKKNIAEYKSLLLKE